MVLKIPIHVLHTLLPSPTSPAQRYGLRPRVHNRALPVCHREPLTLSIVILSSECYTEACNYLFHVLLHVKMRSVILSIKRLLIDRLTENACL